jgi:hypothetical protein
VKKYGDTLLKKQIFQFPTTAFLAFPFFPEQFRGNTAKPSASQSGDCRMTPYCRSVYLVYSF